MRDIIIGNDFNVADLAFKQDVHCSYFTTARGVYSWIDHILCTDYDVINVKSCKIILPAADNVSTHLPLRLTTELLLPLAETPVTIDQSPTGARSVLEQTYEQ